MKLWRGDPWCGVRACVVVKRCMVLLLAMFVVAYECSCRCVVMRDVMIAIAMLC